MITSTLRRLLVAGLALVSLSACFLSEDPLIGYWGADTPLSEGTYAHWPVDENGDEWAYETWRGAIETKRRRYVSSDENFAHHNVRVRQLHEDLYIAQWPRPDGIVYGLAWVYEDGRVLSYHQADCSVLSEDALEDQALLRDEEGFCSLDNLEQLEGVMRAYLDVVGTDVRIDGVYRRVD